MRGKMKGENHTIVLTLSVSPYCRSTAVSNVSCSFALCFFCVLVVLCCCFVGDVWRFFVDEGAVVGVAAAAAAGGGAEGGPKRANMLSISMSLSIAQCGE